MLSLAAGLLPPARADEWNQALMDLGSSVCVHSAPRCLICPLRPWCRASAATGAEGQPTAIAENKPRWKEAPFAGSRRYYRGRAVASVREIGEGQSITLPDLGKRIKNEFAEDDITWLEALVAELERDGLLAVRDGRVSLP
jgi:A/G-specific adenine glycosylase